MNSLPVYLDTSAMVKLVVVEPETDDLRQTLTRWSDHVSAAFARVELHRALRHAGVPASAYRRADEVLEGMVLIRVDEPVLARAASFTDRTLRSLDALHLATALTIGDDPDAFITYDARLAQAAAREQLRVLHPGAEQLPKP